MDKVQKIREEVARIQAYTQSDVLKGVLDYIDKVQEEPKFKTGDHIKPIDSSLGAPRTIVDICDSWYVTNLGTLDFEFEDNWELVEEPVSEEWIEELRTKLDSLSKEDFKKVFDKYAIDFNYGAFDIISYLLSKHFDIKNLIEKGLSLKAPEGMYAFELTENEDEKVRKEIIQFLQLPHPQFVGKRDHEKWIAWLEKQKLEWSDVDEVRLDEAIQMVEANGNWVRSEDSVKLVSDWLKSLKERYYPQNHWKPTEEHIKVLSIFADNMVEPYYKGVILDLLEQLKVL